MANSSMGAQSMHHLPGSPSLQVSTMAAATAGPRPWKCTHETNTAQGIAENDSFQVYNVWQEIINCVLCISGIGKRTAFASSSVQVLSQTRRSLNINI